METAGHVTLVFMFNWQAANLLTGHKLALRCESTAGSASIAIQQTRTILDV